MRNKVLYNYSIMVLDTEHLDEICEDIRYQYENGVTSCALFCMTLVPEGTPPVNKAKILCEKYAVFKERLDSMDVPNGVLVQASIGHGWILSRIFPYQKYVGLVDNKECHVVCPYDDGFQEYIYDTLKTIASYNPHHIMIDDDLRLIFRDGGGCLCPLHLKRFNELANTNFTQDEVRKFLTSDNEKHSEYSKIFIETQRESILKTAKTMREAIDCVNPQLPASYCCVGNNAEFAYDIATVLAGEGNPAVVRVNNGNYTSAGPRYFSKVFFRAAAQIAKLKDKVDVILAEADTCPHNRYSTGAMSLHTHFTGTILEGARGSKHWLTRLNSYEPQSGVAYRRILGKYSGFYEKLAEIVPTLNWRGCRIPVLSEPRLEVGKAWPNEEDNAWATCVLERLGIPFYFSKDNGGVLCLEGDADNKLSDQELIEALKGNIFLSSDSAQNIIGRGFGEYIGVDVREWRGKQPSSEKLYINGNPSELQVGIKELIPLSENAVADSMIYHTVDGINIENLFPGTVIFENELGGKVFTFCGTPKADYNLVDAFSFLNYSRKQQLISMMSKTGELPVYYPDDEEVYLRAADMKDVGLFCAVFNIGTDPIENLRLFLETEPQKIEILDFDGSFREISFIKEGNYYTLNTLCNTLDPVILIIRA